MRLEHNNDHDHRTRHTNGSSSLNGSSPHTNGATKNGFDENGTETNGYHGNGVLTHTRVPQDTSPFYGHDREEVTRLILQSLSDLGYASTAKLLSAESGYELEIPSVAAFRRAVLHGEFEKAEELLFGQDEVETGVVLRSTQSASSLRRRANRASLDSAPRLERHGLPLVEGAEKGRLKFLLRQQKYLELLEERDLNAALAVLRNELTPLKRDTARLHQLSGLIMCQSADDLKSQADWDGAEGDSRSLLLSQVSKSISPAVMIPEHRLATLLTEVQNHQIHDCRYHNITTTPSLYCDHECDSTNFPLQPMLELRFHSDEVWYLEFSHDGSMLASAGRDGLVCVFDTASWQIRHQFREHERSQTVSGDRGVVYVSFSPDDQYLISCSQNNEFVVVNVRNGRRVAVGDHFDYPVSTAAWLPDSQSFVIGTQGSRRPLSLYSLRSGASSANGNLHANFVVRNNELHSWRDPPWDSSNSGRDNQISFRISDCTISPSGTRMACTTLDNKILVYDLASRLKIAEWTMDDRLTSINFCPDDAEEREVLVNMNEGRVFLLDLGTGEVVRWFRGVKQRQFVVRSCFGGPKGGFVCSGSEGKSSARKRSKALPGILQSSGFG